MPPKPTQPTSPTKQTRLSMLDRVQLAKRVVAAREKPKPDSWPVIARREKATCGVSEKTIRRVYAETVDRRSKLNDPTGQAVIGETLALYEEMVVFLTDSIADEDAPRNTRVSAAGKLQDLLRERFHLLVVTGRMPRNIAASTDREQAEMMVRKVIETLSRHGVAPELLDELIEIVSGERLALAAG